MVRYGILGFGLHAVKRLMPGFETAQNCTVSAFWRRDIGKSRSVIDQYPAFDLRFYGTPEALCASSDVDAIFVASPDALHLEHVLLAVKHRKPVLCEKPMGMNADECEQMIEAADRAGIPLGVAHVFRFEESVNRIRETVSSGSIGRALLAHSEFHYPARNSPRTWITDANLACGGPVGDVAVHCIDALRYILGDQVKAVYARAIYDEISGDVEAAASLLLEFSKSTIANVTVSTRAEYRTPLSIIGENGAITADNALTVDYPVRVYSKVHGNEANVEEVSNAQAYARQVDAFAATVASGVDFAAPGIEGLRNQLVLDAAYRSIKSGEREEIPIR
jgi:predicted dehydrogenase